MLVAPRREDRERERSGDESRAHDAQTIRAKVAPAQSVFARFYCVLPFTSVVTLSALSVMAPLAMLPAATQFSLDDVR